MDTLTKVEAFDAFIHNELGQALERFDHQEVEVYIYCHLTQPSEPSRRVLVVTEANSAKIAVCIEAAYELFKGDMHHYVRRIGMVDRAEAAAKLEPLVREAYEIIL